VAILSIRRSKGSLENQNKEITIIAKAQKYTTLDKRPKIALQRFWDIYKRIDSA
jgi:hypothetical protein